MATLNDFKLITIKSKSYFDYLKVDKDIPDTEKARLGFYLFALECISNNKEIDDIKGCIIDTDFTRIVFNEENNDLGIDAVTFDDENNQIGLYNFKFRDKFNECKGQNQNDVIISNKFLMAITGGGTSTLTPRTKLAVEKIIKRLDSESIWEMKFYMVSNENRGLPLNDPVLKQMENHFGLKVNSFCLDELSNFISVRPDPIKATVIVNSNSVLSYEEEELSSSKSYLIKVPLFDLIRMTCTDEDLRVKYNNEDVDIFKDASLNYGVLFDNVRGYLGETRFNLNIYKTLEDEPTKFFMYNNGITMTANFITATPVNANKKWKIELDGLQVVNGGQTLKTIYEFKDNKFNAEALASAHILVRLFATGIEKGLTNKIAEYTNSQNAISSIDLKSLDSLQIQIEQFLKEKNILYVRKVGDLGESSVKYDIRISMEKFAQVLYSLLGYPDRASNQKKRLFENYYDEIFSTENFDIEKSAEYIHLYKRITEEYEKSGYTSYEQKIFYVIYLNTKNDNITRNIEIVEKALNEYKSKEQLSDSRKLIQKGYKDKVDEIYKEIYGL